jgi:hypothetical protein
MMGATGTTYRILIEKPLSNEHEERGGDAGVGLKLNLTQRKVLKFTQNILIQKA